MTSHSDHKPMFISQKFSVLSVLALSFLLSSVSGYSQMHKPVAGSQQAPTSKTVPAASSQSTLSSGTNASTTLAPHMTQAQIFQLLQRIPKTTGPKIINPRASTSTGSQSSVLATLRKQITAGAVERTQILSLSNTNSSANSATGIGQGKGRTSSALSQSLNHTSSTVIAASALPPTPPKNLPQVTAIPEPCKQGKMSIFTINGAAPQTTVFTPEQQYDLYTIQGCHFGAQQGQIFLIGSFKGYKIPLTIVYWADGQIITAMNNPNLTGEKDEYNKVNFFLTRADGQQVEIDNTSFYAVRQSVTMSIIPQSWATLGPVQDVSKTPLQPQYQTGTAITSSATVNRTSNNRFSGGQDFYDLSPVNSQFSVDSMQITYPTGCELGFSGQNTVYQDGFPSAQWDGNGILIKLGGTTCHNSSTGDYAYSTYTLLVQVTGPSGVDPTQP